MQLHEETIFNEALDIADQHARSEFLDNACAGDEQLRSQVERLLQMYPQGDALEPTCPGIPNTLKEPSSVREQLGESIGLYKLLEQIGEGGMGFVYMAEQTKPVRRKVALKIIKLGMDTGQVIARFEAERQALALMNHPNIAKVLDAGETETGRPFFVMELVKGIPVTEFCDQQKLSNRQRLELFIDVCEALQHAHQKGIIHRDIKPSNVLVELHDVKAIPKIIDFGIAKATNQQLTERTLFTQFAQMIGTPMYMSPEQAQLSGLDIDTRSDIYSLGVLLYELLTGSPPFDRETFNSATFDEMRRIIREDQPPLPSHRVSTLRAEQNSTIAENRDAQPKLLRSNVERELDGIVMKALEKDRTRRYESANAFGRDVRRHLDGDLVQACPPSMRYRLRKFSRRYKGALATVAVTFAALIVGTGIATWQAVRAEAAAQLAEQKRDEAERNLLAAMDAVERLLANVSNPKLANVPGLQETWASILQESLDFYDRFKADSGSSPEIDYRAAKVFLQLGELTQVRKMRSDEVIENFSQGLELADAIVLREPKRVDYRELQAELNVACARSYILGLDRATAELDARAMTHYQRALEQFEFLALAEPSKREFQEMQGRIFAKMAGLCRRRSREDPRVTEFRKRAADLGYESHIDSAWYAQGSGDRELAAQHWRTEIARYRSDPAGYQLPPDELKSQVKLWWANAANRVLVDEDPNEAERLWQEAHISTFELLKEFPSHEVGKYWFNEFNAKYSTFLLHADRRSQAMDKLNALIQSHPAFHAPRARVLGEIGDLESRLQSLSESIQRYPAVADYYYVRAGVLEEKGEMESALADLNMLVEIDNSYRSVHRFRGDLLLRLGRYERAVEDFTTGIALRGRVDGYNLKRRAAAYFELGKYAEALSDLNLAIDRVPGDLSSLTWIAPAKVAACPDQEFKDGIAELADRVVQLKQGSTESRMARAVLLMELGLVERARKDFVKVIRMDDSGYYTLYTAALLALQLDDRATYRERSQKLVSTTEDASEPMAKHFAAWTAALSPGALDNYEPAINLAEAAVKQQPTDRQFLVGLGAIQMRAGEYQKALASLQKATDPEATGTSSDAYVLFFRAMTFHRLDRVDEAVQSLQQACKLADKELSETSAPPSWNRKFTLQLLRSEAKDLTAIKRRNEAQ